ncbi:hypothetical protein AOA12_03080 [Microbacterium sp. No. 7]|nr:hypothetical protein AOA12_03080 [Microbacterium sp. No. 7]
MTAVTLAGGSCASLSAEAASGPAVGTNGLVWAEEFAPPTSGSGVRTTEWHIDHLAGGWGNNELQAYTPRTQNLYVDRDGILHIVARKENYTDPRGNTAAYTSARIETVKVFRYGRIESRIKVPAGQGLWSAFWTLGAGHWTTGWPTVGEIDIVELLGDAAVAHAGVHAARGNGGRWNRSADLRAADIGATTFANQWHVYAIEWSADKIEFFVDDVSYLTVARSSLRPGEQWAFDNPQHLLLNLAVGGNWPGSPDATTPFPAEMLVDWVRVYDSEISTLPRGTR